MSEPSCSFVRVGTLAHLACSTAQQDQHNASVNQQHAPFDALTLGPRHSMYMTQGLLAQHQCKIHGSSTSETFIGCKWPNLHLCPLAGTLWGLQVCPLILEARLLCLVGARMIKERPWTTCSFLTPALRFGQRYNNPQVINPLQGTTWALQQWLVLARFILSEASCVNGPLATLKYKFWKVTDLWTKNSPFMIIFLLPFIELTCGEIFCSTRGQKKRSSMPSTRRKRLEFNVCLFR